MMIRVFLVIIFSILGLSDLNASDTSVPKPQELLKIYQKNLNKFRSCFYLDIDRERDDTSPVFHFAVEGDRVKAEYRELNNPDAVLEVALHHDALLTAMLNRDLLPKEDESAIVVESQLSTVEDRLAYLCNVVGLGSFCGYMPIEDHNGKNTGMVDIVHAISAYDLETKADTIDEKSLVLLQATGDNHTKILIWFDPSTNYEVKRIEKSISNAQPGERSRYIYQVQNVKESNGQLYPEKFTEEYEVKGGVIDAQDGKQDFDNLKIQLTYHIKNVSFEPGKNFSDFQLSFAQEIPNGTPVIMRDAPQIEYIWMDEKIVPKTDERMLAIARQGHKFVPGKEEPRFWLMAIGILVILIAGGIHLRRYLKSED